MTPAVTLHVVSPTGEATSLALDRGDLTIAVTNDEVRLVIKGEAQVGPTNADPAERQLTNPTLIFSRATTGGQNPIFQMSADRVTTSNPVTP